MTTCFTCGHKLGPDGKCPDRQSEKDAAAFVKRGHERSAGAAPIDVEVLRDAMIIADRAIGVPVDEQIDHYTAMAIEVVAEYARLLEGTD